MKTIIALLLLLAANAAQALDLGANTGSTPYDAYMTPVKRVLSTLDGPAPTMERVQKLMREGRSFRYSFTEPYTAALPSVTASIKAGDCKAKALWLAAQMDDQSVRFVVGKARANSPISHAWVMWKSEGRWWILDCTNTSRIIAADSVSQNEYLPLYSWSKNGVYRHTATQERYAAIAAKRKGVAANDRKSVPVASQEIAAR